MSRNNTHIERAALGQRGDEIAPRWGLELQDALLDVAAVITAAEPARTAPAGNHAAAHLALTLHWTLREPVQRTN